VSKTIILEMSAVAPTINVSFTLNGSNVQVSNADPNMTLNEWIRSQYGLSGTKKMCGEGGCGCCVVSVLRKDPTSGEDVTISINSVSLIIKIDVQRNPETQEKCLWQMYGSISDQATFIF